MAYNQNGNSYPQREKNVLDDRKLRLSTKNEQGKWANLSFGVYSNNPRVTVYSGIDGDKDNGRISANMDTPAFYVFLHKLAEVIDFVPTEDAKDIKYKIENKRPNFQKGGGRPNGTVTESELWFGKSANGVVWLSVTGYQRPKIQFKFGEGVEYHSFFHGNGEQFTEGELSKAFAKAYLEALYGIIPVLKTTKYVEPQPKQQNGGGYNGGGQQNGYSKAPSVNDDAGEDLPF